MNATVQNASIKQATASAVANLRAYDKACDDATSKRKVFANSMALVFVPSMQYSDYAAAAAEFKAAWGSTDEANQKAFERAIREMNSYLRSIDSVEFTIPKAGGKAAQVAAKRESAKAAEQKALEVIAKAKGLTVDTATPAQLLQLATDPKLTTANKKILVDAAMKKEKADAKEKQKAANDADKAVRDEIRDLLAKMHGAQLAKALAALKKIK